MTQSKTHLGERSICPKSPFGGAPKLSLI